MNLFFFLFFLQNSNENKGNYLKSQENKTENMKGEEICKGPHRYFNKTEKICKCESSFITDDEDYDKGCWKCKNECKGDLKCRFSGKEGIGKCKCESGFAIINSTKCHRIKAKILDFIPPIGEEGSIVNFTLKEVKNFDFKEAFCKFNSSIVTKAYKVIGNVIQCKIPTYGNLSRVEMISLSVSYDGDIWTDEPILFAIKQCFHFSPVALVVLLLCSAMIPICSYLFIKNTTPKMIIEVSPEEVRPLFLRI